MLKYNHEDQNNKLLSTKVELDTCDICGQHTPTTDVCYTKLTGLVIIARFQRVDAIVCENCNRTLFKQAQIHCLTEGWWGFFTFFAWNPAVLVLNVITFFRTKQRFAKYHIFTKFY